MMPGSLQPSSLREHQLTGPHLGRDPDSYINRLEMRPNKVHCLKNEVFLNFSSKGQVVRLAVCHNKYKKHTEQKRHFSIDAFCS